MAIDRILPNICTERLAESRDFYTGLLGFEVGYDSDWFVQLTAPGSARIGLGLLRADHDLVPSEVRGTPRGAMLTVVVDDADEVHRRAQDLDVEVVQPPQDTFYGQRRLLVRDPDGMVLDISSPTAPAPGA